MSLPILNVFSSVTAAAAPFMAGHLFRQGDVPAGSQVVSNLSSFQCAILATWPDGSAKHAVLGGNAALTAGAFTPVQLAIGTPAAGTNLTTAAIKAAAGSTVVVDCGSFGSVSWAGTDWDAPFETHVAGPRMANFRYRKAVGSDSHLVIWVEATVWATGQVRFHVWPENGYTKKAGVTNKVLTYTVTIAGTVRESGTYDIKHHARPVLVSGGKTHHWIGADPDVMLRPDVAYMQSTGIFAKYMSAISGPAYDSTNKFAATSSSTRALVTSYAPGDIGNFTYDSDDMRQTGYQCPIGLLPTHDIAFFVCNTQFDLLYKSIIFNAYAIGRYSIFRRDENTNRPPSIVTHATLVLSDGADGESVSSTGLSSNGNTTPLTIGGRAAGWDVAHSPRAGLLAYAVTGEKFHLETAQAVFTTNWLSIHDYNPRISAPLRFMPDYGAVQTRAAAWGMSSLVNAVTIMPDADPLKAEYVAEIERHIVKLHSKYAVGGNQFGIVEPGEEYTEVVAGHQAVGMFQQDFTNAVYGHLVAQNLPFSAGIAAKALAFFTWKSRSILMRLGAYSSVYKYENCAAFYRVSIGATGLPNYESQAGPFLPDVATVYNESASPNYPYASPGPGIIGVEFGPTLAAQGQLGNMMPGLAYAVQFGVPGASDAYARLTSASNWPTIVNSFKTAPVWAVEPLSGVTLPAPTGPCLAAGPGIRNSRIIAKPFPFRGRVPGAFAQGFPQKSLMEDAIVGAAATDEFDRDLGPIPSGLHLLPYTDYSAITSADGDGTYIVPSTLYKNGDVSDSPLTFVFGAPVSTVTGVTVSPSTATGSATFTATVQGANSPSQAVTWSRDGSAGSINASTGAWVAPAPTSVQQVITITATSTQDGTKSGTATVTIAAVAPGSTITAVTVSPTSVTQATGTVQFTPVVTGTGSFSTGLTRTASAGSISSGNLLTLPAQTSSVQTVTVTWTSVQDGSKSATATVTVPALIVLPPDPQAATRVGIVLQAPPPSNALVANATGIHYAFFAQPSLETLQAPIVKGSTLSTDGSAVLDLDIAGMTSMLTGDKGILALSNADFTTTTLCHVTVQ